MLGLLRRSLWGNLTDEEFKRFGILSMTFLFIIGSYWLLRVIKDGIFGKIVGTEYMGWAKIGTLFILVPLVLGYSKLVDMLQKHTLFYIICGSYSVLFLVLAYMLNMPGIGLDNTVTNPHRILGWVTYFSIETFGSLVVALFWSFVANTTDTASAKKGYPLIIGGAQFGSIAGPALVSETPLKVPALLAIGALCIAVVPFLIKYFSSRYTTGAQEKPSEKKTGIFEGLFLLLSHPYLMGVLAVSTLYEVIGTILDIQFKIRANEMFATAKEFSVFMGRFGIATNALALVFAFVGTGYFIRRFGLTFCLVMFPTTLAVVVLMVWWTPGLYMLFAAMLAVKSLSYALNNPCKEMLYIPTSKDIKFKAKSWMDSFGGRSAKAAGSSITNVFINNAAELMLYGSLISLGIIGAWIAIAYYVGTTNKKLVDTGSTLS